MINKYHLPNRNFEPITIGLKHNSISKIWTVIVNEKPIVRRVGKPVIPPIKYVTA